MTAPENLSIKNPQHRLWIYAQWCRANGATATADDMEAMADEWKADRRVIAEAVELRKTGVAVDAAFFAPMRHEITFKLLESTMHAHHGALYHIREGGLRDRGSLEEQE